MDITTVLYLIAFSLVFLAWYLKKQSPVIIGFLGERNVKKQLNKLPESYKLFHDVMFQLDNKMCQIDHIVVSEHGIFVLETKNYSGTIYGSKKPKKWTQYIHGQKYQMQNPLHQNYGHMKSLSEVLNKKDDYFIPLVVFNNGVKLKLSDDVSVSRVSTIRKDILSFTEIKLTKEEHSLAIETIQQSNISSKKNKKKHIRQIKANLKNK
ncbi:MAG: nuclease-related domain-containing protein [Culicoidibacterales bacterium]